MRTAVLVVAMAVQVSLPAVPETPTVLILYSEAGFWGQQLRTQLVPPRLREDAEVITSTELQNADLLGRVSSVRLRCGSRDSHVMLSAGRNTSGYLSGMSASAAGYPILCRANTTTLVNFHTNAPQLADRVASVYFVVHAPDIALTDIASLVQNNWDREVRAKLPDGARVNGPAKLRLVSPGTFTLTQELRLDHWACTDRAAHLEVAAHPRVPTLAAPTAYFDVNRGVTYVDDGFGDAYGCREKMPAKLRDAGDSAAAALEKALHRYADAIVPGYSRYYMVPTYGTANFWLAGGAPRSE